ncbi:hypothetical protein NE857_09430 [Nocardiopsis exhalans]|uniref:Uncharacterized protein n=1 Tax=Nocardiopsis exhalans TaxID=163604 RepID=A0ABY5DCP9_9ACTN|nr:hypothetical protein [Nocardiopsis exhalans]USY21802.1 hypothetical protein NE857_09430 [Nocardiopsis exhalans]
MNTVVPSAAVLAALSTADPETGSLTLGTWPTLRSAEANGWIIRTTPGDQTDRPNRFTLTEKGWSVTVPKERRFEVDQIVVRSRFPRGSRVIGVHESRGRAVSGVVDSYADLPDGAGRRTWMLRVTPDGGAQVLISPHTAFRQPRLTEAQENALVDVLARKPISSRCQTALTRKGLLREHTTPALTAAGRALAELLR